MPLVVEFGSCSLRGPRERNEDFVGVASPSGDELAHKGLLAAVADGVSGHGGGREAAESCVRGLLSDYYATPDTWKPAVALERVVQPLNQWIAAQAQARREAGGMATTLTALLLRGRGYHLAHVGDTRAYLLRGGDIACLTTDHVWDQPEMRHVLTRAIGLDERVTLDYSDGLLQPGDAFVLASDGVWSALGRTSIRERAEREPTCEAAATSLCEGALEARGSDNASAIVLRVKALPDDDGRDLFALETDLLPPRVLGPGQEIDGFRIDDVLRRSSVTVTCRVTDRTTGTAAVLKTLTPDRGADPAERHQFAHEAWIARRMTTRFFPQVIDVPPERRSALYYVQTWHDGATLADGLDHDRHLSVPEVIGIGTRLARALGALHRRSIVHRDVKPENVHLGADGELRVLDFGVAISGASPQDRAQGPAGTPSYLAPEQFAGAPASPQTDLYAAGVTLYRVLTRRYPYGEIEPFQRPRFGDPAPPSRYRPDTPPWLENVLLKAVASDPARRFETAEEMLLALERGAARPLPPPPPTPLLGRAARNGWRTVAAVSIVVNVLLAYVLFALWAT